MEKTKQKYKVRLNNMDKIESLLQETYDLACQQYKTIQEEINKIANSTVIKSLDIDGKEKYAKAINNYIALQQKSIAQKMDIAKLMTEVVKHNGNVKEAIDASKAATLDLDRLRDLAKSANSTNESEEYNLKGRN